MCSCGPSPDCSPALHYRLDDLVDGAAAGVAQLVGDLLVGQALQLELDLMIL